MAKRGLMGSVLHEMEVQARANAKARSVAQAAAAKATARRVRDSARAEAQRSLQNARTAAEVEKARKAEHIVDQESHVTSLNLTLESDLKDIDSVLAAGLATGGYFDLETLRSVVVHPDFVSPNQDPTKMPQQIQAPEEPELELPAQPKGLSGLFKKSEYTAEVLAARLAFEEIHSAWQTKVAAIPMLQMEQMLAYSNTEQEREQKLELDRVAYDAECKEGQSKTDIANASVEEFMSDLKAGKSECVEDYIQMVFTKSSYPESLQPSVKSSFDSESHELRIDMTFPRPTSLPQIKNFKYVKSGNSITENSHSQKELKDRYNFLVSAITLRSLHEIFDADRFDHIHSVSFIGGVTHLHEGLGKEVFTPLVHVAVSRESFKEIDLSKIVPSVTLKYLGGVVSKNLYVLEPVDVKAGVRSI